MAFETSFTDDAAGRMLTTTNPLGEITSIEYDDAGRRTQSDWNAVAREGNVGAQLRRHHWNAVARGGAGMEHRVAAATSGSPVLKHGPLPPAAEEGVNALGFSRGLSCFVPGRR